MRVDKKTERSLLDMSLLLGFRHLSTGLNERDAKELLNKLGVEGPKIDGETATTFFNKVGPGEVPPGTQSI